MQKGGQLWYNEGVFVAALQCYFYENMAMVSYTFNPQTSLMRYKEDVLPKALLEVITPKKMQCRHALS